MSRSEPASSKLAEVHLDQKLLASSKLLVSELGDEREREQEPRLMRGRPGRAPGIVETRPRLKMRLLWTLLEGAWQRHQGSSGRHSQIQAYTTTTAGTAEATVQYQEEIMTRHALMKTLDPLPQTFKEATTSAPQVTGWGWFVLVGKGVIRPATFGKLTLAYRLHEVVGHGAWSTHSESTW